MSLSRLYRGDMSLTSAVACSWVECL